MLRIEPIADVFVHPTFENVAEVTRHSLVTVRDEDEGVYHPAEGVGADERILFRFCECGIDEVESVHLAEVFEKGIRSLHRRLLHFGEELGDVGLTLDEGFLRESLRIEAQHSVLLVELLL